MKAILICLTVISFSALLYAESKDIITVESFLLTAKSDNRLTYHRKMLDYLEDASAPTPYLDEIEIRTQTDDFELRKQQFTLRFEPKGWGESSAHEKIREVTTRYNQVQYEEYLSQAFFIRYMTVINYLHTKNLLDLHQKLALVYKDRINVYNEMVKSLDFDVTQLLDVEDDYIKNQLEIVELQTELTEYESYIKTLSGKKDAVINFDKSNSLPVNTVEKMVQDMGELEPKNNVYLKNSRLKIDLAAQKYELELAQNRRYLSFFEIGYDHQKGDKLFNEGQNELQDNAKNSFTVEFGFRLPFINKDQDDIDRRKLSYIDEQLDHAELSREIDQRIMSLTSSLGRYIAQYRILAERKSGSDAEGSFARYQQMEGINPLTLLKLKESMIKGDVRIEKISWEVHEKYIKLLDIKGILAKGPVRNYLSEKQEEIAQ